MTKRLSQVDPFVAMHPQVPWRGLKVTRSRLTHGYFDISLDVGWDTVPTVPPSLPAQLPAIRDTGMIANNNHYGGG